MKIATVKKRNEFTMNVTEMYTYGLRANGYNVDEIEWNNPREVIQQLEHYDYAFIPASDLCHPEKPQFATRGFIGELNRSKAKIIMDVNDEPTIHKEFKAVIWPHYRGMVWPGSDKYLHKWTRCERIIHEPIVGEHHLYHRTLRRVKHYGYQTERHLKKYDVVFNGSMYGFRIDFINALTQRLSKDVNFKICSKQVNGKGIPLHCWYGNEKRFIPHEELNTIYNQARILLSFGIYADGMDYYTEEQLQQLNQSQWVEKNGETLLKERSAGYPCRIFSFLGSGSFTLADQRDEQHRIFKDGIEAVSYNSVDDCAEKIHYYLQMQNVRERERIATAGYERYLAEHTIEKKMARVMAAVLE